MKYKVGDKVRVRKDLEEDKRYGDDCVVSDMMQMRGIEVTISEIINNTKYRIKECAWSWTDEMFEPKCDRKILITSDGVETLARMYDGKKVVKTKTAKCSPEDVFDFATGAKLAFGRLMGEDKPEPKPKPEYYSGKVVCTMGSYFHTKGKVYEVKDGVINDDSPCTGPYNPNHPKKTLEELGEPDGPQFIPFVEDKPPFDWEGFKAGKFAVHCDTKERARMFLNECAERGIKWCDGEDCSKNTHWGNYREKTCYRCDFAGSLLFGYSGYFKTESTRIIPYK